MSPCVLGKIDQPRSSDQNDLGSFVSFKNTWHDFRLSSHYLGIRDFIPPWGKPIMPSNQSTPIARFIDNLVESII